MFVYVGVYKHYCEREFYTLEEKKKILAKFNIKDYKNDLEIILENKHFDEEAKSLLLNIFYKYDNFYKDYMTVKKDCEEKNAFLENYINIIKTKCKNISIMNTRDISNDTKYIIDRKKGEIKCLPIEIFLAYALFELNEKDISSEKMLLDDFTKVCVKSVLSKGRAINKTEPIRDFNGWSWNVQISDENIIYNLIFQNLIQLLGYEFVNQNITKTDILVTLMKQMSLEGFGEIGYNFLMKFFEVCILIYNNESTENHLKCLRFKKSLISKKNMLNTRKEYVEDKTKTSSGISKQIKQIDNTLSDIVSIRKEYEKSKGEYLCISEFVEAKEKEKEKLLKMIKENNKIINQKQYLLNHDDYETTLTLYDLINEDKEKVNLQNKLIELQKIFLECIKIKIADTENKREIYTITAEMRYYANILLKKDKSVLSQSKIAESFDETTKQLINKMLKIKIIDIGLKSEKLNYEILKYIFKTKIIDLEELIIKTHFTSDKKIDIEYYDGKMLDYKDSFEIPFDEEIVNKKDKKIKVFKIGG